MHLNLAAPSHEMISHKVQAKNVISGELSGVQQSLLTKQLERVVVVPCSCGENTFGSVRQIRCTEARISPPAPLPLSSAPPLPLLSKPRCDWSSTSSLIVAAYRAGRGAAGVVHGGRQPRDNSCTGGRKSLRSEQEKLCQGQAR